MKITGYIVVCASEYMEDDLDQLSNMFDTYEKAVEFRDSEYNKRKHPYARILACTKDD